MSSDFESLDNLSAKVKRQRIALKLKNDKEMVDHEAFCRQYAKEKFYGDPLAAAAAAGLKPENGYKYLQREAINNRIAQIRKGDAATLSDDYRLMKLLEDIMQDREDTKPETRIKAVQVYRDIRNEVVLGKIKASKDAPAPKTINNTQVNYNINSNLDNETEDKLRRGEITIEEAAAIGCEEVGGSESIEKKLRIREQNHDLARLQIEMDLDKKAQRILAKTKDPKTRAYLLDKLKLQKQSMGLIPMDTQEENLDDEPVEAQESITESETETDIEAEIIDESTSDETEPSEVI